MTDYAKVRAILDAATQRHVLEAPERHEKVVDGAGTGELDDPHCDDCWETWPCTVRRLADLTPALLAVAEAAGTFVTLTDDLARWDELNRYVINSERDYLAGNVSAARERLDAALAALDALHAKMKETL